MTHHCRVCGAFLSEREGDDGTIYKCGECDRLYNRPP
jgi:DNA-directed RNA polymerase subunit M/transcription elongation factor TFIIS